MNRSAALLVASVVIMAWACSQVALTGRSQLLLISDAQMAQLARQSRTQFLQQADREKRIVRPTDSEQSAKLLPAVTRAADRIIEAAGLRSRAQWRVFVIRTSQINANASADGTIVVYTGILPIAKTEAGLAAVLGHEVAHVVARHSAERLSQQLLAQNITNVAVAATDPKYQRTVAAALGLGGQYGILLPFSREHESEADHLGLYYMAKAGYDPADAPAFWQRMAAAGGSAPPEFMSTHPSHATRIAQLQRWLPDARRYFEDRTLPLPTTLGKE